MFTLPEIKIPSKEELTASALRWWSVLDGVKLSDYNEALIENTIPFYEHALSNELIVKTLGLERDPTRLLTVVEDYKRAFPDALDVFNGEDFFFKLNSRSPKDFNESCRFSSWEDVVFSMFNSERCFDDLAYFCHIDQAKLIFRPFVSIPKDEEWRVFVYEKEIVGISQYFWWDTFEFKNIELKESKIRGFVNSVVTPNMIVNSFVVDVIAPDEGALTIIETNPFGYSDPCLFDLYEFMDGSFRYNKNE